ncbi:MAG: type II toxin-antitoxin system PemK/MazF family toxin [Patescibacteria group bacterium]|jgi:mRNA interferase MazF
MVKKARPKQGDIFYVDLEPKKGHEQGETRPVIVISNNDYNNRVPLPIVCPVTTTDNGFPLHLALPSGLKTTGYAMIEHCRTIDYKARGWRYVESAPIPFVEDVNQLLFSCL